MSPEPNERPIAAREPALSEAAARLVRECERFCRQHVTQDEAEVRRYVRRVCGALLEEALRTTLGSSSSEA